MLIREAEIGHKEENPKSNLDNDCLGLLSGDIAYFTLK